MSDPHDSRIQRGINSLIPITGMASPFDAIRRTRPDGSEYWSARDLQATAGYSRWEDFAKLIARAISAAHNTGVDVDQAFSVVTEKGSGRPRVSYELSRIAAYLTVMNGDPNMPRIAEAQAYFAIRTREAETRPVVNGGDITRMELIQLAMNAETERLALEAKNAELEPKAEAYDNFLDATGKYSVGAVAKMLGTSQNKLFRDLRNAGVFIAKGAMHNTPYQQFMHHFEVIAHEYERSNGETGCSYTTYVQPSGIDFIRRKLGLPSIDPQFSPGGASE